MAEFIATDTALLNPDHVAAAQLLDDAAGGITLKVWITDGEELTFEGAVATELWQALAEHARREPWA